MSSKIGRSQHCVCARCNYEGGGQKQTRQSSRHRSTGHCEQAREELPVGTNTPTQRTQSSLRPCKACRRRCRATRPLTRNVDAKSNATARSAAIGSAAVVSASISQRTIQSHASPVVLSTVYVIAIVPPIAPIIHRTQGKKTKKTRAQTTGSREQRARRRAIILRLCCTASSSGKKKKGDASQEPFLFFRHR